MTALATAFGIILGFAIGAGAAYLYAFYTARKEMCGR